ncbi:MAG TPA: GNAT family N-acetyltransferase [Terriglobales bacterium]
MHIEVEIDCGTCRIRALERDDLPALAHHANNPRVAAHLRDRFPSPYSIEDGHRFLDYADSSEDECVAGIAVQDEIVGVIGVQFRSDIERCSAELGYWLGEPFWRRGITTAAIRCFTAWAMPRFQLTRVYAEVFDENVASARVLEKAGFSYVGLLRKAAIKNGTYHDYRLYDLVR